mmetsp:Transcript_76071/g.163289  ORF Transcript_76071/g.163289 Transcript_76071/m.163289 type:complete len:96 (-) Transcript_76071:159-446(-)
MIDFVFGLLMGAGVGSYNARYLRDCLDDTFHLTKQKAVPAIKKVGANAGPMAQQLYEQAGPALAKAKETATPYMAAAQDAVKQASLKISKGKAQA